MVRYGTLGYGAVRYVGVCLSPKIGTRRVPTPPLETNPKIVGP